AGPPRVQEPPRPRPSVVPRAGGGGGSARRGTGAAPARPRHPRGGRLRAGVSDNPGGGFRRIGEHDLHAWRSFRLVEAEFVAGDGTPLTRTFLRHPGAAAIVPIDGEDVVLVRQFRPALGAELLEIPAGTLDRPGESPSECAARELQEEVGARATRLDHLVSYTVAPGVSDE